MKIIRKDKFNIPRLVSPLAAFLSVIFAIMSYAPAACAENFAQLLPFDPDSLWKSPDQSSSSSLLFRHRVEFWVQIYRELSIHQIVIHDAKYLDHIYEIITTPHAPERSGHLIQTSKEKWRRILKSLHQKQQKIHLDRNSQRINQRNNQKDIMLDRLTAEEKAVAVLFNDVNEPHKFLNAMHRRRLRAQFGQRENFCAGLESSAPLLPIMEDVFKKYGMPPLLTRLPFVESSFNVRARSKVGASGIWQFIKSTALLFIKVDDSVDERNDPILATGAAAQLLRANYESLGSWPLAITAYNHGRKGVMRALRKVGSNDLEEIIEEYHYRAFGFASSNFFSELLAAIEVQRNAPAIPPNCGQNVLSK